MKLPQLHSEDIKGLRQLYWAQRRWKDALRESRGLTPDPRVSANWDAFQTIKATRATQNAIVWIELADPLRLEIELNRWWALFKWEQTRAGWRAFRFLKGRRQYAKKAFITCRAERSADVFVRLTGRY